MNPPGGNLGGTIPAKGEAMSHDNVNPEPTEPVDPQAAAGRRADALRRVEMASAAADQEAVVAQKLIDHFIVQAHELGILPEPLRMQLSGGGTARTDKSGWYIKVNRSVAIGEDGGYYVLSLPGGLRERLTGVHLHPTQPSLEVSRGGRDGETGDLADFLAKRLASRPPK